MDKLIIKLYQSPKTIFSNKDLSILWQESNKNNLKSKISYYVKTKALIRLKSGLFARDKNFNFQELAAKFYSPAYISFETVLREEGLIFQHYETIFVASRWSASKNILNQEIKFRKLKNILLFNPAGINMQANFAKASKERAFLDTIYLFKDYYFDNLRSLDWQKCEALVKIYDNKQLIKRLKKYNPTPPPIGGFAGQGEQYAE